MKILLVTGGAGFIGSNFIRYFLKTCKDVIVVNYDKLTYAGNLNNLSIIDEDPRYYFVKGDICDQELVQQVLNEYDPDYIINFAAESHVDRSIDGPTVFAETNVLGTLNLLECARNYWMKDSQAGSRRFVQISTDEVYGSIENDWDCFTENSLYLPNSPYSASKAGADLLARAFYKTFGFPAIVTRCCNNYGSHQHKEKFIPTCIIQGLKNKPIPLYGDGTNVREWIHVMDHCAAITHALFYGAPGEIYNIGSGEELSNLSLARLILENLGKGPELIRKVNDRPGHDKRYALDSSKAHHDLKWSCTYQFKQGIAETVQWYRNNQSWWENC
ncbi:dTDP-glucose 4,6-dehydratase [Candidatus Formimonas warabiya]|uniref:dTDP-glucose 4,6-dehydratase n=1 Tax=Formimonas warabiya TaxID=1761012 RepID=A0A3G1KWZ5_FORW1|nr:dTDP-glucose 4,6-dehydratase [Candidatus Formimonas warabiya]ATW26961.1 dTDP-glucose 4,6-dehydratase [Candidatus Formimonas warabiya]